MRENDQLRFNSIIDQTNIEGFYQYALEIEHPGGMGNEGGITFELLKEAIHKSIGGQETEIEQARQNNISKIILNLLTVEQITKATSVDSLPDYSLLGILTLGRMEMSKKETRQLLNNLSSIPQNILDRQITNIGGGTTTIGAIVDGINTAQSNRI